MSPLATVTLTKAKATPDSWSLYRAQRMIRLGEWLDSHEYMIKAIYEIINRSVGDYLDGDQLESPYMHEIITANFALMEVLDSYETVKREFGQITDFIEKGVVTTYHPHACKEHKHTIVARVSKPKVSKTSTINKKG